jgi:hypothetical protein
MLRAVNTSTCSILAGGVRYTRISYELTSGGPKLDASSVGLFASLLIEPGLF